MLNDSEGDSNPVFRPPCEVLLLTIEVSDLTNKLEKEQMVGS